MKSFKRKLNSKGFSHIELGLLLIVVIGLTSVGYYVYKHTSHAANTYTTLAAIKVGGKTFTEEACITAQSGSSPNYTDTVAAVVSVNAQAGPSTIKTVRHGRRTTTTGYNPSVYYVSGSSRAVTEDNWTTATTSTISFDLPPASSTTKFNLGVEAIPGSRFKSPGSSQAISSITLCNPPAPKVSTPSPTLTFSASPTSVTAGATSKLSWTSTNATSCTASGSWSGTQATSGSYTTAALSTSSNYTLSCSGPSGTTPISENVTVSVAAPSVPVASTSSTCSTSQPTVSTDSLYPLLQVTSFTGSSLPSVWHDYGNEVQAPAGYVAADHAVFVPNGGLQIKGYPDPISGSVGGVTGGSGDLSTLVPSSGGYDVCLSMSAGSWQNVHLVIISWPTDNNWNEGELDFFEGNPQSMQINVHEIGSSPATNVWQGTWPAGLATGTHLISARWDPVNGYRFYLDNTLVGTAAISSSVKTPTTSHDLSIQMQDTTEASTSTETATIYWTASYGYN